MGSAMSEPSISSKTFSRQSLTFPSGKETCHAWFYRPASTKVDARLPVIVMAHGLGGVKALCLAPFAERFAAAGYACLVFDYRYFGDSSGQPRELLDIPAQQEDWRAAVRFARSLPELDPERVIIWGTSFGGGHAIVTAAEDSRVAAAIAQCPFTDGPASVLAIDVKTNVRVTALALADQAAKVLGMEPVRVNTVGLPGEVALMTSADTTPGYLAMLKASGLETVPSHVPARIALQLVRYRPGKWAKKVKCPMLFAVCEADSVAPAGPTLRYARQAPKGEIRLYSKGHFDIYLGEAFERNVADQLAFLQRHVPSAAG